jgi:hypothetical protein
MVINDWLFSPQSRKRFVVSGESLSFLNLSKRIELSTELSSKLSTEKKPVKQCFTGVIAERGGLLSVELEFEF